MGLAERLHGNHSTSHPRCWYKNIVDVLDPADLEALDWAMAQPVTVMGHRVIAQDLQAEGHNISEKQIQTHRSKYCRCDRPG